MSCLLEVLHREASFCSIVARDLTYDSHGFFVIPTPEEVTRRLVQGESKYAQQGHQKHETSESEY
jgi:hypothetical protein